MKKQDEIDFLIAIYLAKETVKISEAEREVWKLRRGAFDRFDIDGNRRAECVKKFRKPTPIEISIDLGMHYKRARYSCLKWRNAGWFEFGLSWRNGRLTEAGKIAAEIFKITEDAFEETRQHLERIKENPDYSLRPETLGQIEMRRIVERDAS